MYFYMYTYADTHTQIRACARARTHIYSIQSMCACFRVSTACFHACI